VRVCVAAGSVCDVKRAAGSALCHIDAPASAEFHAGGSPLINFKSRTTWLGESKTPERLAGFLDRYLRAYARVSCSSLQAPRHLGMSCRFEAARFLAADFEIDVDVRSRHLFSGRTRC
jgi:hypothetical protein